MARLPWWKQRTPAELASRKRLENVENAPWASAPRAPTSSTQRRTPSARFEIPTGEDFRSDYLNLFPSASVSYRPTRTLQFRLSYSRRVQRPSGSVLNPMDRSTDPTTRRVGNPDIEPQFTHSVTLNVGWQGEKGGLRLSPYYRRTLNDWAETIAVDTAGVSTRTYNNLASQTRYGVSLTYTLRPVEGWNGFISVGGSRLVRDASNLSDRYSGTSFRWSSRARIQGRITKSLFGEGSLSYNPPATAWRRGCARC